MEPDSLQRGTVSRQDVVSCALKCASRRLSRNVESTPSIPLQSHLLSPVSFPVSEPNGYFSFPALTIFLVFTLLVALQPYCEGKGLVSPSSPVPSASRCPLLDNLHGSRNQLQLKCHNTSMTCMGNWQSYLYGKHDLYDVKTLPKCQFFAPKSYGLKWIRVTIFRIKHLQTIFP